MTGPPKVKFWATKSKIISCSTAKGPFWNPSLYQKSWKRHLFPRHIIYTFIPSYQIYHIYLHISLNYGRFWLKNLFKLRCTSDFSVRLSFILEQCIVSGNWSNILYCIGWFDTRYVSLPYNSLFNDHFNDFFMRQYACFARFHGKSSQI